MLAAHIQGKLKRAAPELNVVLVADIDMLRPAFFRLREQGEIPELGVRFDFDNVTFVLNALDELAGDDRFIDIRSRRPKYRTLTRIEERTKKSKLEATQEAEEYYNDCDKKEAEEQAAMEKKIDDIKNRKNGNSEQMLIEVAIAASDGKRRLESTREQLRQKRDREVNKIETDLSLEVRRCRTMPSCWR